MRLTLREKVILGAMLNTKIKDAMDKEEKGVETASNSKELKLLYHKLTGIIWEEY